MTPKPLEASDRDPHQQPRTLERPRIYYPQIKFTLNATPVGSSAEAVRRSHQTSQRHGLLREHCQGLGDAICRSTLLSLPTEFHRC